MDEMPFEPLKKCSEPVFTPEPFPAWDCEVTANPRIYPINGHYLNFYTGYGQRATRWGIGCARSRDLLKWERTCSEPLLATGPPGTWNHANMDGAWICPMPGKGYGMFYEGRRLFNTYDTQSIGLAISHGASLDQWSPYPGNPVFTPTRVAGDFDSLGLLAPIVYRVDDLYWMFYSGFDGRCFRTGLAFSDDGVDWRRYHQNPIFDIGPNGAWDCCGVVMLNLMQLGRRFYALYEGLSQDGKLSAGVAASEDLLNWRRISKESLIHTGLPGSFDEKKVCSPFAVIRRKRLYVFFGAHPAGEIPGTIGLAVGKLKPWAEALTVCFGVLKGLNKTYDQVR